MKLSLKHLRSLQQQNNWSEDVLAIGEEALEVKIGAQLGAIEEVVELKKKYDGAVIVKIVSCIQHPDADKLHVCLVDDNNQTPDVARDEQGLVEVVCGAPNVREGILVVWLPPGAVVPDTYNSADPFKLEARTLRGIVSNGMLASPKELDISDSHEGILEIEDDIAPGTSFASAYNLDNELIFDIENKMFTHRPDCFGVIGLARELAGIQGLAFKSPDWYSLQSNLSLDKEASLPIQIINELPELVPKFSLLAMTDVRVTPSPLWLVIALKAYGIRSINNIVDLTNYFMVLTGQPLHAYDYDKIKALSNDQNNPSIIVRKTRANESLELLNGKTINPWSEAILIATDKQPIGLAGVMGGSQTEVDELTTSILIEAGNFNMYAVRRTSMHHGIFTDAATRFTKGQSPLQITPVIIKIAEEIALLSGAKRAGDIIETDNLSSEVKQNQSLHSPVSVSLSFINHRLGSSLDINNVASLLTNVEFEVQVDGDTLLIKAPFWRSDIELKEDIVEEVGRLYGYDQIPATLPLRSLKPVKKDELFELKASIRQKLLKSGASELLTYSFVDGELMAKVGQDKSRAYEIGNALRPELQYYRLSLLPSLLDKVHLNIKAGHSQFALYEIGKSHNLDSVDESDLPIEKESLGLVVSKDDKLKIATSAYYMAKEYLINLIPEEDLSFEAFDDELEDRSVMLDKNRAARIYQKSTKKYIGYIGEFKPSVTTKLKLPKYTAGFEIDTISIPNIDSQYKALSRFPSISQDISLKTGTSLTYAKISNFVSDSLNEYKAADITFAVSPLDIYVPEDKKHRNITLRIKVTSYERTLSDKEVNSLLDKVAAGAKEKLGVERI